MILGDRSSFMVDGNNKIPTHPMTPTGMGTSNKSNFKNFGVGGSANKKSAAILKGYGLGASSQGLNTSVSKKK